MWIIKRVQQEPVMFQAFFALLAGFGVVSLTQDQMGLIFAFTASLLAFITRQAVTPLADPRDSNGHRLMPRDIK
ncbi:hypothetical protein [Phormidium tenue]|uniref:Uncharacterized protein n=1 Tax=Phormidium tenue NIES-30 TaxID=549789 RepID=A0A1U7J616_9CYAN|nr:hypothetical protein [Phormidium tenue]MBD2232105.1 hypothetical protein [Phormidium tenue FACHB-1052]OKH48309.1 hypothetical protein NIES30_09735 [Phormidium tenue NIES-30]